MKQDTDRGRKTSAWLDKELMNVDGLNLVYTISKDTGDILVRLPGRLSATIDELRARGHVVTMPKALRVHDYAG